MSEQTRHRCKYLVWFGDWYCRRKLMTDAQARAEPVNPVRCTTECPDWQNGDLLLVQPRVEEETPKA